MCWISVLQCVAVCCSVLQCVAVCCGVLQCQTRTGLMPHKNGEVLLWLPTNSSCAVKWESESTGHVMDTNSCECGSCHPVAVCCSVLQYVALRCHTHVSVAHAALSQCVAVGCSVLQCVAVCCTALPHSCECGSCRPVAVCCSVLHCVAQRCHTHVSVAHAALLQCVALCCTALPHSCECGSCRPVAVCCTVLQCVAVCCTALPHSCACGSCRATLMSCGSCRTWQVLLWLPMNSSCAVKYGSQKRNESNDKNEWYGVATVSRINKITGLFCRISSLL